MAHPAKYKKLPGGMVQYGEENAKSEGRHVTKSQMMRAAYMAAMGRPLKDIEARLGVDRARIRRIFAEPLFKHMKAEIERDVMVNGCEDLASMFVADARESFETMKKWRDQEKKPELSYRAAVDMIDRAIPKVNVSESRSVTLHITPEDMKSWQDTMSVFQQHSAGLRDTKALPVLAPSERVLSRRPSAEAAFAARPAGHLAGERMPGEAAIESVGLDEAIEEARTGDTEAA